MQRNDDIYGGVWTALATPMFDDGRIDWDAFTQLLNQQAEAGVSGVVVAGTTGESSTLTVQEKLSLVRKAKVAVGEQLLVMVGSGGQSTEQSIELSRLAVDAGADALLVVTPPYIKPNPSGLKAHFHALAQNVGAPICLYHVPGRTNQRLSAPLMAELCHDPHVCMIKEASGDLALFSECQILADATMLSGDDFTFLASLAVGGRGCISVVGNLFPRELVRMQQLFMAGDVRRAQEIHDALFPVMQALFCETNPCPLKAALAHLGICGNYLRLPLAPVSPEHYELMATSILATRNKLATIVY